MGYVPDCPCGNMVGLVGIDQARPFVMMKFSVSGNFLIFFFPASQC